MESSRLFFDPSACHGNMFFLGNRDSIFQGSRTMMMNLEEGSRRRPFLSSPDALFDEEYYDEQSPEKKRRLTSEQVHMLERSFEAENKLEPERKTQLANKLGLQPRQVAVWFQNRRARWKTKQLERDYDILKSSYDSLLSNYESVAKENDKLKSEVISLTEKLQVKEEAVAPVSGQKHDPLPADMVTVSALQFSSIKAEDRLSSGSGGSAVVVESGDSYFSNDDFPGYMVPSEEDDGSDDGQSYFCNAFAVANEEQNEGEMMQWWVWS